jgi:signal transduction histidine kinase
MTLNARLTLVMVALVMATAAAVGFLTYHNLQAVILPVELSRLQAHVQQLATTLDESVAAARNDITAFANAVPLEGLIRAHEAGGKDPEDGVREEIWRVRLAHRFVAVLAANPYYLKLRLIGAESGGRELVRADRFAANDRIRIVSGDELQDKGQRFFFVEAMRQPAGGVFVSPITLNQENGRIYEPHVPMLRTGVPVFTAEGKPFGALIINVNMGPIFDRLRATSSQDGDLYILNESGDFLAHPDSSRTFGFDLGARHRLQDEFPSLADAISSPAGYRIFRSPTGRELGAAFTTVRPAGGPRVVLLTVVPKDQLLQSTRAVRDSSLLAGLAAAACAAVLALLLARSLSRPVVQVTAAIKAFTTGESVPLPEDASGEAGVLARAFTDMRSEVNSLRSDLEQRVAARTAELEAANKELEAFSYSVSHDLRAPLRAVDGFSDALQSDYGPSLPAEARRYLAMIRDGAQRMGTLIDDLLAFSRLGRQPLRITRHDPGQLVREALADIGGVPPGREIVFKIGELPAVSGDRALLKQVWINLLSNAVKYTRPSARAVIEVAAMREEGATCFSVRDNGTGFDMKYAHKLFGVFQRLHRAEEFEGTGVGLAIVQRILQRHGGRVWAQAGLGKGATFFFTLPDNPPNAASLV